MKKTYPLSARSQKLIDHLAKRILVLDGAMGTRLQNAELNASDFGGEALEGCNENLVLTRPDLIQQIHEEYLASGADIVETNTFGGTPLVLAEYGLEEKTYLLNKRAAEIARAACAKFDREDKPRFVAGSIGPTTKAISVTGGVEFWELVEHFEQQAEALFDGGADYFLIETCQDTRNIKAALFGIDRVFEKKKTAIPIAVSGTIEPMGTMLAGQSIEALIASLNHRDLLYIGLNCATGPEFMTDHLRSASKLSRFPLACVPNAGLPDENGKYLETPSMIAGTLGRFMDAGWINLVGGCCGTTKEHIAELARLAAEKLPRKIQTRAKNELSGIDYLEITDEMRPIIVGERTNVIGSRKFKRLICEEKWDEATEIAKAQIRTGAQIIDICLANPDRDELSDTRNFLEPLVKKIKAPIMIDSTDEKVIDAALEYCQGKAIISSINLEDGEERFEKVVPLAHKWGAALVVGTIDDDPTQSMGVTRERKLAIAERSYLLLTEKYGILPEDIYWDPLVFPCATGDAQYIGSALETIEGVRLIKQSFPGTRTVLGISNVSFGLPEAGREVLNSVFLYHCVMAGLDLAIVNSEKLIRYTQISELERTLAENLLFNRGEDSIALFANHFRTKKVQASPDRKSIPLHERLARAIVEGTKDGLVEDLEEALTSLSPLEIINGPLMKGMDEVGKLFNENKLIVAEVLQSAEVMKAAVGHLEPKMEKNDSSQRGSLVLATVKGDVHDIGKNLVDIIFSNNGFKVINLGIKVPPDQLISAIQEHKPSMIGLSGLLVKSAQQMVVTAEDLNRTGINLPILVGGAALSSGFVDRQIAPVYQDNVYYAQDAMSGLELAKKVVNPETFAKLQEETKTRRTMLNPNASVTSRVQNKSALIEKRSSAVNVLDTLPSPPDFDCHLITNTSVNQIWPFINPLMLYGRHMGIRGSVVRALEKAAKDDRLQRELAETEPKSLEIWRQIERLKAEYGDTPLLHPRAIFQFLKAESEKNTLRLLGTKGELLTSFTFPRQQKSDGLCLADYTKPAQLPATDSVALFVVTVGKGVREMAENLKSRGLYLDSHALQALALESAEAYAEYLHSLLRKSWGFADPLDMTMMQRFQAKYRGKRYSFGYPACPNLEDQSKLFDLLKPERIGVQLTDGFMMDPEASVSAIVFHHPAATYFSVGDTSSQNPGAEAESDTQPDQLRSTPNQTKNSNRITH